MKIGFIGFGKVAKNLVNLIKCDNITFLTSAQNRSKTTIENIENSEVMVLNTFKDVALNCDILISVNSPNQALNIAVKYGKYLNGIYLDLNNISPKTTFEISKYVDNLIDGAIIGKIDSSNPILYLSGKDLEKLDFLSDFLELHKISEKLGDASKLKLLRSMYTKSVSAILIESSQIAKNLDLEDEFFDSLTLTEGKDFKNRAISRINNTKNSKKRKAEELTQIIDYFEKEDLTMVKASLKKLNQ
ncbi:NAD(P)-dependent oxidoreductase [uncultured Methanobrevibacter sp.]|uniref:NAD(P)-dependent oxidoreductase n=1 Tax=uncultured Methanobrevibacter sp. TaxID=253161 RepID=UPI0026357F36|nr:NAD(P)-dependent oxidoreductase [uncultured Methanobrevibacter sp.]